jgi:hypothetical protein
VAWLPAFLPITVAGPRPILTAFPAALACKNKNRVYAPEGRLSIDSGKRGKRLRQAVAWHRCGFIQNPNGGEDLLEPEQEKQNRKWPLGCQAPGFLGWLREAVIKCYLCECARPKRGGSWTQTASRTQIWQRRYLFFQFGLRFSTSARNPSCESSSR